MVALVATFLALVGALVVAPSVSYADTPVARIDDASLTLASAPTTAAPPLSLPAPDTPVGRQALAGRSGRVTTQVAGIPSFNLLGLSIRAPQGLAVSNNANGKVYLFGIASDGALYANLQL